MRKVPKWSKSREYGHLPNGTSIKLEEAFGMIGTLSELPSLAGRAASLLLVVLLVVPLRSASSFCLSLINLCRRGEGGSREVGGDVKGMGGESRLLTIVAPKAPP